MSILKKDFKNLISLMHKTTNEMIAQEIDLSELLEGRKTIQDIGLYIKDAVKLLEKENNKYLLKLWFIFHPRSNLNEIKGFPEYTNEIFKLMDKLYGDKVRSTLHNKLFSLLHKAALEMKSKGNEIYPWSRFDTAKDLGIYLEKMVNKLETGNETDIELVELWVTFAPTGSWDESGGSFKLAIQIDDLIEKLYRERIDKVLDRGSRFGDKKNE